MTANDSLPCGRYRVGRLLARGGMSEVFVAHDERLGRQVALKVLRGSDPVERSRFERETRLLAGLTHPNLVRVYDAGETDDGVFLVLELVEGRSLAGALAGGRVDPSDVARLGTAVAEALAYVHGEGVIHRDVKPSNILLADDGRVLLGDFGIARIIDDSRLTATATTVGTAAYMAPEQVEGSAVTAAADIYALGLVLLEALTGRPAFPGPAPEAALARLTRDPDLPPDLPSGWAGLVRGMTSRRPRARPTATDAARIIATRRWDEPTQRGDTSTLAEIPATESTDVHPAPVPSSRLGFVPPHQRVLAFAVAFFLLFAVGGASLFLTRGSGDPQREPTTTAAPRSTSTVASGAPAPPPPASASTTAAVDCAALEAQRRALDERKREVNRTYRHDRETRQRLTAEIDDQKRAIEDQLQEHCR